MSVIVLSPQEVAQRVQHDAQILPQAIGRGIRRGAQRGRSLLVHESPVDTGQFKNAWRVTDAMGETALTNDAPHAGIIERGARPHSVSREGVEAIRLWVRRRLGAEIKLGLRQQFGRAKKDELEQVVENVVWGIVRKLRKEGQKGHFIVRDNLERLRDYAAAEVQHEVDAAFRRHR